MDTEQSRAKLERKMAKARKTERETEVQKTGKRIAEYSLDESRAVDIDRASCR